MTRNFAGAAVPWPITKLNVHEIFNGKLLPKFVPVRLMSLRSVLSAQRSCRNYRLGLRLHLLLKIGGNARASGPDVSKIAVVIPMMKLLDSVHVYFITPMLSLVTSRHTRTSLELGS